ncbi:MAG: pyridoxal phosphate-dependent aminotransferase [Desulfovibrionaceae bacterium]|jgi:aspartate aminotransferase|nr:pyridoxal phosphate-dependent aminotransferase [Desulfovibrionaceae bacterium]
MRISDRLMQVKPSATLAVSAKAMELRAQGREIISLSAGESDFPTPAHVCEAAKRAIDEQFVRYTQVPGIPELRTAAAAYFKRFYGVDAPMEAAILTNGGKQALFNLCQCLLNPGDEALIPAPYWVSYPAMVLLAGGVPVVVPSTAEAGFKVTVEDLERCATARTRLLIINSPSNPTGVNYDQAELDALAEWAVARDVFVVSDEIYDQLVYAPSRPCTLAGWWAKHPEHVCVCNGLAKSFAMTGWRVGFALAHPDLVKVLSKIQSQSTSNICSIAQKAALAALTGDWDFLDGVRAAYDRRRRLLMEIMASWPDVVCPEPQGAFYVFPDLHRHYRPAFPDSASLCTYLLEQAGVATVPGAAFGDDNCIRISYALGHEVLQKAMDKIAKVLF